MKKITTKRYRAIDKYVRQLSRRGPWNSVPNNLHISFTFCYEILQTTNNINFFFFFHVVFELIRRNCCLLNPAAEAPGAKKIIV